MNANEVSSASVCERGGGGGDSGCYISISARSHTHTHDLLMPYNAMRLHLDSFAWGDASQFEEGKGRMHQSRWFPIGNR